MGGSVRGRGDAARPTQGAGTALADAFSRNSRGGRITGDGATLSVLMPSGRLVAAEPGRRHRFPLSRGEVVPVEFRLEAFASLDHLGDRVFAGQDAIDQGGGRGRIF